MRLLIATTFIASAMNVHSVLADECLQEENFNVTLNKFLADASSVQVTPVTWFDGSFDPGSYEKTPRHGPSILIERSGYATMTVTVGVPSDGKTPTILCFGTGNPADTSQIKIWEDDG